MFLCEGHAEDCADLQWIKDCLKKEAQCGGDELESWCTHTKVSSCKPLPAATERTSPKWAKACLFKSEGGLRDEERSTNRREISTMAQLQLCLGDDLSHHWEQVAIMLQKWAWQARLWEPCLLPPARLGLQPSGSEFTCKLSLRAVFKFNLADNTSLYRISLLKYPHFESVSTLLFPGYCS